jgi:hypothetical protein
MHGKVKIVMYKINIMSRKERPPQDIKNLLIKYRRSIDAGIPPTTPSQPTLQPNGIGREGQYTGNGRMYQAPPKGLLEQMLERARQDAEESGHEP